MADKTYKLTFNMGDGTSQSVQFTAPQGPKGDTGPQGVITATGLLKGTGSEVVTAVAGEDYQTPLSAGSVSMAMVVELSVSGWNSNQITVSVTGVTANNNIIVAPGNSSREAYLAANIRCTGQGAGTLTFAADNTPTQSIVVNVLVFRL